MKLKYPIQIRCKAGYFDALAQTGTRNTHRFNGIGLVPCNASYRHKCRGCDAEQEREALP